jgi:pyruvate,orthophosphate dikinase
MVATDPKAGRKFIYRFQEGNASMRDLLGGKGANLCEMASLDLPVPPGFVITTETCRVYYENDRKVPDGLWDGVRAHIAEIEEAIGKGFGDPKNPLLVSVRSGAKMSMPGMMDTILNLGLNDETTESFAKVTDDRRFALDSYRRFIQLFSKVALGLDGEPFEDVLVEIKKREGAKSDADLGVDALEEVVKSFKQIAGERSDVSFPMDPWDQLKMAVTAVFNSWNSARAIAYRDYHDIPHDLYTAANVMAMVFGNSGWDSGTGVCFTRSPSTGEAALYGEYLKNAQGEDVVSGARTPLPIAALSDDEPEIYDELSTIARKLETHYKDAQDIEFTVEHGKLYMLQTRAAKRNAIAATRMAVEMVNEGLIDKNTALQRVPADDVTQLLLPRFDEEAKTKAEHDNRLLGRGLNASPGAATGVAVFESNDVARVVSDGKPVILVRPETSPDDMPGILRSAAVLTSRGGITSHAAVVTRGLGKPAVVGCSDVSVSPERRELSANGAVIKEGEEISVDGFTGEVFAGHIDTVDPDVGSNQHFKQLLEWADEARRLGIRANADTPPDAKQAIEFGAEGIGLCRTEHMFFQPERLSFVRQMLLNATQFYRLEREVASLTDALETARNDAKGEIEQKLRAAEDELANGKDATEFRSALDRLAEYQQGDFRGILEAMDGKPVVIRLLDAPLHEFLPPFEELVEDVAVLRATNGDAKELAEKEELLREANALREQNPMMGHRGCRLGLSFPAVYEMQVRAIVRAAIDLVNAGKDPHPEVMIPLVVDATELQALNPRLIAVAEEFKEVAGRAIPFGTMIELPRAALTADRISPEVRFFSFGSNDLTQMTFGFSRDDAEEKFLADYVENGILPDNPFATLDENGVGQLVRTAVEKGRAANPDLQLGLCGEHGGDPRSIDFCHRAGLTYVSCSPMRIPIARLAAAQAALGASERDV